MFFSRDGKKLVKDPMDGNFVIGGDWISKEGIEAYRRLEKTKGVGCGDYLLNSNMPYSKIDAADYFSNPPLPELISADFKGVKKVFCYNGDEIIFVHYHLDEKWLVSIGDDGVFVRGEDTPLRRYVEARFVYWQNKSGKVNPEWTHQKCVELQEELKKIGIPPISENVTAH